MADLIKLSEADSELLLDDAVEIVRNARADDRGRLAIDLVLAELQRLRGAYQGGTR